jgi:ABC-type Zn uptake system ZnuABC Zn-binding protein ZnuA
VGLGLDTWKDAIAAKGPPKARTLRLGDRVPTLTAEDGTIEANIWMDPQRARLLATAIAEELGRADSSHAIAFGERASVVDESIAELDKEVEAKVAALPHRSRIQLPASFAYFADRYGLHALKPGDPTGSALFAFDPFGGTGDETSYEQIVRHNTVGLARLPL